MAKKTKASKSDALRTWISWARNAVELLREKGVDFSVPSNELTRRVDTLVIARAYAESLEKPKIQMRYEYPLEMFLRKAGEPLCDPFERSLPQSIEIVKMFIPFADGSVLLLQMPSEETIQCGTYLKMLSSNPSMAKMMGADAERLGALKEIVDLALAPSRVNPLDPEQVDHFVQRESAIASMPVEPMVQVNLASSKITASQAVAVLMDFLQSPTDTITASVDQLIAHEFGAQNIS